MSENKKNPQEEIQNTAKEIQDYFKDPDFGVDTDRLIAFVDKKKITWKIRPDGHTKLVRDKIIAIQDQYKKDFEAYEALSEKEQSNSLRYSIAEKATKAILETGLIGFNYDEMANHEAGGPSVLQMLSNEVSIFLVESGGRAGHQLLLMQRKLGTLNQLISSMDLSKSGTSSNGQGTT